MGDVVEMVKGREPEKFIEALYMKKASRRVYIALEDLDFSWDEADIPQVRYMWKKGLSIWDIARAFDRDPDEVAILIMDLIRKSQIRPRPRGAYGRRRGR